MVSADKLARLVETLEPGSLSVFEPPFRIERTYAGRHQRSAGAWSWMLLDQTGNEVVGSCFPVREIIRAGEKRVILYVSRLGWTPELIIQVQPKET